MKYIKTPCIECPWRRDVPPGKFPPERFMALAHCAEDMAVPIFACHRSKPGEEFACAGFLLQSSAHNLSARMARQDFEISSPFDLFPTYRAMAIANGVPRNHPSLRHCRDDGQRR